MNPDSFHDTGHASTQIVIRTDAALVDEIQAAIRRREAIRDQHQKTIGVLQIEIDTLNIEIDVLSNAWGALQS